MSRTASIHVTGIVQGVGFRPFVYRIAKSMSLAGYVLNLGDAGVRIVVHGNSDTIEEFVAEIRAHPPSISRIDRLDMEWIQDEVQFNDFEIVASSTQRNNHAVPSIPPDIAMCKDCMKDLTDPESRWHSYAFTSCAACGPRFSTITSLPYDRPNTTMVDFPLCSHCETGYRNPGDRRYHAETTACEKCGPKYWLADENGNSIDQRNPVAAAGRLIDEGYIVAVQGIGGTHIATMTSRADPILELRRRKKRSQRPFAIMVRSGEMVKWFATSSESEAELLESWQRPIVLLKKLSRALEGVSHVIQDAVIDAISPGLGSVGVMLPYSPVHHLLFQKSHEDALVMTSANPTGVPMYIEPDVITENLSGIVDYFLLHNRVISQRVDDSVLKIVYNQRPVFLRRARGYVPESVRLHGVDGTMSGVAVGPEEKATGAVLKSGHVYLTQHIGDTDRAESIEFLSDAIEHMRNLVACSDIQVVACDHHPDFLSTEFAERLSAQRNVPLVRVQHHYAHLAALVADLGVDCNTDITCIAADGYGYGLDGSAWGGEVLVGNCGAFRRTGGLMPKSLPGGDLTARYAIRSLVGILDGVTESSVISDIVGDSFIGPSLGATEANLDTMSSAIQRGVNIIKNSSAGRFLDAASAALGVCFENTYDGECPMKLEAAARETNLRIEPVITRVDGRSVLDTSDALLRVIDMKRKRLPVPEIAYAVQEYLGRGLAELACMESHEGGIVHVGFSGGVALNRIITAAVARCVDDEGLHLLIHERLPPGDGCISVGQIAVAAKAVEKGL